MAKIHHIDTEVIHGGAVPDAGTGATAVPIYQTSAFAYDSAEALEAVFAGKDAGYVYTRMGNPTVVALERRINALEGTAGATAFASGMAAITATVLAVAGAGDEIVSGNSVFGGTYSLFTRILPRYGIRTRFVESADVEAYRAAINDKTRLVFVEAIGNPKLDVPDLAAIAAVAKAAGVALAVDSTAATPVLLRPAELGATLVIHSVSKYLAGHGTTIGGMVCDAGNFAWPAARYPLLDEHRRRAGNMAFLAALRGQIRRDLGMSLAPFNAFMSVVGTETLAVRMDRHCRNALQLATFLQGRAEVGEVRYPGLPADPAHDVARRQFGRGFGGLVTLRLGTRERAFAFVNRLQLASRLTNIGDSRTLVVHPRSTFCRDLSDDECKAVGVTADLVRISVGIEYPDDIVMDVEQALKAAK